MSSSLALSPSSALSIIVLSTPASIARLRRAVSLSAANSAFKAAPSESPGGTSAGAVDKTKAMSCPLASSESIAASNCTGCMPAPAARFRRSLSRSALSSARRTACALRDLPTATAAARSAPRSAASVSPSGVGMEGSTSTLPTTLCCGRGNAGFGAAQQPLLPPLARTGRGKAGVIARGGVTALVLMVALSPA